MNNDDLNEGLIEAIKERVPNCKNLAGLVMDTIFVGKEAAYRRLRGEVPFSFAEASEMSHRLGISLDNISNKNIPDSAIVHLDFVDYLNPIETYCEQNDRLTTVFNSVRNDPSAVWYSASNTIPQVYPLEYDYLSRFLLFKWMYQHEKTHSIRHFSELKLNRELRFRQRRFVAASMSVPTTFFIWDRMMFYNLINDIKYFHDIHLITNGELKKLKDETYALLDKLEGIAVNGRHPDGKAVHIFVSHINFDATYSCIESSDVRIGFVRVYSINLVNTTDPVVFNMQKDWIQSLMRYSTLISESGEMQRMEFFAKQRQYLEKIL